MNAKQCIESQLVKARQFSEGLLEDFHSPEQWTHQVHPNANHALWFVGHMGVLDNFFISNLDPARTDDRPEYQAKFGTGSQPTGNPADYPPIDEVLAYMRERRRTLLELLSNMSEDDLNSPTIKSKGDFLPDRASVFQTAIWHEGLHSGQVSVARRALGHLPVFGQKAAK